MQLHISFFVIQSLIIQISTVVVAFQSCTFPSLEPIKTSSDNNDVPGALRVDSLSPTKQLSSHSSSRLHMNFFKDLIDSAFENDSGLSSDKSQQQLEGPNDDTEFSMITTDEDKTEVQKRWLEAQSQRKTINTSTKGAPINANLLPNTSWELSLYLTGVPDFDPSNSLFGSKVNISTRKDSQMAKEGFAIGADSLPSEPSVTFQINLLENGMCQVSDSSFTTSSPGEWKLSDDERTIRFSLDVKGYQRTVTTQGTIQNVYWSNEENVQRATKATYSIDAGMVVAEAPIGYGSKPGVFTMAGGESGKNEPGGILKVEKRQGMFGVSSIMVSCGKFSAAMIVDE